MARSKLTTTAPDVASVKRYNGVFMTDRKTVTYEEIAYSNMMSIEALVSLLTRKGLITQQEI